MTRCKVIRKYLVLTQLSGMLRAARLESVEVQIDTITSQAMPVLHQLVSDGVDHKKQSQCYHQLQIIIVQHNISWSVLCSGC